MTAVTSAPRASTASLTAVTVGMTCPGTAVTDLAAHCHPHRCHGQRQVGQIIAQDQLTTELQTIALLSSMHVRWAAAGLRGETGVV